jgi:hypothetical protein
MNASPFIHRNGHVPLRLLYLSRFGYAPEFPSFPTPEDFNSNYAIFKEIDGDKGLRNATHFHWNLKKISISTSCVVSYFSEPPGGGEQVTVTLAKSRTAYDPQGAFVMVGPPPETESGIPQPAAKVMSLLGSFSSFIFFDPILEVDTWKTDQDIRCSVSFNGVFFIESIQRWVAEIHVHGTATAAQWSGDRETRYGLGYVDYTDLIPGHSPSSGYSVADIVLPAIFEAGNKVQFLVGSGDTATVALVVSAEYWTY